MGCSSVWFRMVGEHNPGESGEVTVDARASIRTRDASVMLAGVHAVRAYFTLAIISPAPAGPA